MDNSHGLEKKIRVEIGATSSNAKVNGYSALHWAVIRGKAGIATDLVDAGAAVNEG